ncbi:MAG: phytanoyl-CoA dioxygenase family protein [Gammaproteobacteria bacterium]|nr:phytanoyl-CoA dioxygenase family protein [Gammaproteobacteria bacterium]
MNIKIYSRFLRLWALAKRRVPEILVLAMKRPQWFVMFAFSRLHVVRNLVVSASRRTAYQHDEKGLSVFPHIHIDDVVETLNKDGICVGLSLPAHLLQEILDYAMSATYLGDGSPQSRFYLASKEEDEAGLGRRFTVGYDLHASLNCTAVLALARDPKVWAIAAQYLECKPLLLRAKIWWTFVGDPDAQLFQFHYDLEDYRSLKFLFYLTDVNSSSGPHCCIKGSHKKKKLRHQLSLNRYRGVNERELLDYYGKEKVMAICEKAGFGLVEDPFCFHKGTPPVTRSRLVLEILFSRTDYAILPEVTAPPLEARVSPVV